VHEPRTVPIGNLEEALHALELSRRDDRAKVFTRNNGLDRRLHLFQEHIVDRTLHQDTRPGRANLTGIEGKALDGFGCGSIDVRVVKNNVGGLTAKFQRQRDDPIGSNVADGAPYPDGPGV